MIARVQWLPPLRNIGVLRVFEEWGRPLLFVATVRRRGAVAKIYAAKGEFQRSTHRAIEDELVRLGIRRACFERFLNGRHLWFCVNQRKR